MLALLIRLSHLIYGIGTSHKGIEPFNGRFRVVYKDGKISQRMYLQTAYDYASIFGGRVIKHKEKINENITHNHSAIHHTSG